MKILLTSPTYLPFNSGLGNAVSQQAKLLVNYGHEVVVATGGPDRKSLLDASGLKVEYFNVTGANSWIRPIRGDHKSYISFLQNSNWDVIVFNAWQNWATDLAIKNLKKISGRKYLYSHCISTNVFFSNQPLLSLLRYLAWRIYWWSLPKVMNEFDGLIFLALGGSDSRFDDFRIAIKNKMKFEIVPNSISPSAVKALSFPSKQFIDRDRIISVGSYNWQKGFDFVLRAYAISIFRNKIPLHLYGQEYTKYTTYLLKLADKLNINSEYLHLHEGVLDEELINAYMNAKLILFGSHTECQPKALVDASATGTPFVARKTGCVSSLPGGIGVSDYQEMAEILENILNNSSIWEKLSSEAINAAQYQYHPDIVGKTYLSSLEIQ